jgi:hypothetical protein
MLAMDMRADKHKQYPGRTCKPAARKTYGRRVTYFFFSADRFYTGTTVFDFGAGMSYTSFNHTLLESITAPSTLADDGALLLSLDAINKEINRTRYRPHNARVAVSVAVHVKNTGERAGEETLLGFVHPPAIKGAPIRSLRQYEKMMLEPGKGRVMTLRFTAHDLALASADGQFEAVPGNWAIQIGQTTTRLQIT